MGFAILTDTSANMPAALMQELHIQAVPFCYIENGQEKSCLSIETFDDAAYYQALGEGKRVTTSMVNQATYTAAMEPIVQSGQDLLVVCMSSGISGTCGSARAAAQELSARYPQRQIQVVDTLGASLGEGLIALEGARLRDAGKTLAQTAEALGKMVAQMRQVFTVDDLMFLMRGGRISRLSAVIGSVLHVKPILIGNGAGKIVVTAKCRGRKAAIRTLADELKAHIVHPQEQVIGIAHAGCREDANTLASMIRESCGDVRILLVKYEPVTGAHVGPGALALFYLSDLERVPPEA